MDRTRTTKNAERHSAAALRREEMEEQRLAGLKERLGKKQRDASRRANPPPRRAKATPRSAKATQRSAKTTPRSAKATKRRAKAPAQTTDRPNPGDIPLGVELRLLPELEAIDEEFNISRIMDIIIRDRQRSSTGPKKGKRVKSKRVKPKSITGLPGTPPYGLVTLGDPGEERRQKLEDFLNFIKNYYALERENESIKNEIFECRLLVDELVDELRESNPELDIDGVMEKIKTQELRVEESSQASQIRSGAEKKWPTPLTAQQIMENNQHLRGNADASADFSLEQPGLLARNRNRRAREEVEQGLVSRSKEQFGPNISTGVLNAASQGIANIPIHLVEGFRTIGSNGAADIVSSTTEDEEDEEDDEDEENINITLHFNKLGNILRKTEARLWTSLPLSDDLYSSDKEMVKAEPYLANNELNNLDKINGKVVVIKRGGGVDFADKINKAIKGSPVCIFIVNTDDEFINCTQINHNIDGLNDRLIHANIPVLLIKETDEEMCDPANTVSFIRPEAAAVEEESAVAVVAAAEALEKNKNPQQEEADKARDRRRRKKKMIKKFSELRDDIIESPPEPDPMSTKPEPDPMTTKPEPDPVSTKPESSNSPLRCGGYKRKKTIKKKRKQSKKVKSKRRKRTKKIHKQSKKVKSKRH